MTDLKDGGPAFPTPCDLFGDHSPSMSLRDWFAGQALAGLLAPEDAYSGTTDFPTRAAEDAYAIADAMLAEREKGNG